jgi:hypothetical protein
MRLPPFVLLAALVVAPPVAAQVSVRVGAGVTLAGALVSDAILYDDLVSLTTGIAPTLAVGIAYPVAPRYRLLLEGRLASASLRSTDNAGERDLGSLRTLAVTAVAEGPLPLGLRFHAGGGFIRYAPSDATGVFADGSPTKPMVTAGISWVRPLRPGLDLHLGGRWDMHEFTTSTLQARGWSLAQRVHRLGLTASLERGF